ncbi:MAG: ABC transporter permease [Acidimicrobiales bacterium]
MITVTFADLAFRARQFLIALVGVSLVMAMALLLSGLANGFRAEVQWTVNGAGGDHWVLAKGAHGGVTAFASFSEAATASVARQPGVAQAGPFLLVPGQTAEIHGAPVPYVLAGVAPGRLGDPAVAPGDGHALDGPDQAVVDDRTKAPVGSIVELGNRSFTVVGTVTDRTLLGGLPLIYLELTPAQAVALGGRSLITAVITRGLPSRVPAGLRVSTSAQVIAATIQNMKSAISSINNSTVLMWIVAAIIVAALLYVAALERRRDFAVLKALGASSTELFGSLMLEAVVVTLLAAAVAEVLSHFMTFVFTEPLVVPLSAYIELPLIAIFVGMLASLVALRNATGADPAAAFS